MKTKDFDADFGANFICLGISSLERSQLINGLERTISKILSPYWRDKHMVEHEHFNQQRAVQYYADADIRNTLIRPFTMTKLKWSWKESIHLWSEIRGFQWNHIYPCHQVRSFKWNNNKKGLFIPWLHTQIWQICVDFSWFVLEYALNPQIPLKSMDLSKSVVFSEICNQEHITFTPVIKYKVFPMKDQKYIAHQSSLRLKRTHYE